MKNHKELARSYFLEGYNCSQSVLLAFHEELGLDKETAARMASPFGGGMGRLREVCGTVSGMLLVLGLLRGYERSGGQKVPLPAGSKFGPYFPGTQRKYHLPGASGA